MPLRFSTKARTLEALEPVLRSARILPQERATVADWRRDPAELLARLRARGWFDRPVIVRSSALGEDGAKGSMAGRFASLPDVLGEARIRAAIEEVIASYDPAAADDEVLVQPMLADIALSGVAFSQDPNTAGPYMVVNYDDRGASASSVTGGTTNDLRTFVFNRLGEGRPGGMLGAVVAMVEELEGLFGTDRIDVEFAVTSDDALTLLQVRQLVTKDRPTVSPEACRSAVNAIAAKVDQAMRPHPFLRGSRTVLGVMPDWNPAEIIGIRPRPLALSLYRTMVTDSTWAYQRDNYGYRNLRGFPLMVSLHGLPYIDVRVSFNSFIPKDVEPDLAARLVDYYIDRLEENPSLHDKVEFEILFSCYDLNLRERLKALRSHGFTDADCERLADSLRGLTNRIINGENGHWRSDLARIVKLERRQAAVADSPLDPISRIYWLLEDCKRYGTLPFAGLARAGFIAVQMLRSLVQLDILSQDDHDRFMGQLNCVSTRMAEDFHILEKDLFLARYGHLRPGTYDIMSPRYDEAPDRYFDWTTRRRRQKEPARFALSLDQLNRIERLLRENGLEHDVLGLFAFIGAAIEGREHAKFVFTRSLSDALRLFGELGSEHGFSLEDCAFADIRCIADLSASSASAREVLGESIDSGRRHYALTRHLSLPPLIFSPDDVWQFHLPRFEPNFITQGETVGPVRTITDAPGVLEDAILFIPSADPGFDWIFSKGIAGFVTQYGGVNSHMAIRAGEIGMPAVVGAGETLYNRWSAASRVRLDCAGRQVQMLS